jgi:multiple sugar transport system permease protein
MSWHVWTAALVIIFLFPMLWAAFASVAPQPNTHQVFGYGLGNYVRLMGFGSGLVLYLWNSIFLSGLTVGLTLLISLFGGYAFARFSFRGKDLLFLMVLAIIMVPAGSLLIPLYVLLHGVGLGNSLVGVALVLTLFQLPFATFMMRISFESIPLELEESALVDGAGSFAALRRILLPLVRPGLITVGLFAFLAAWNDFVTPLILINDDSKFPLPVAMAALRQQTSYTVDYGVTEAGVVALALPCLLIFLVLQRFYVRGFMSGALKG